MTTINKFEHPSHPGHTLKLWFCEEPYECHACKEPGFGLRYACTSKRCDFHLHAECAHAPPEASHELFPGCLLSLRPAPGNCSRVCSVCRRAVRGITYRCSHSDLRRAYNTHPRCLAHPRVVTGDGGIQMRLSGEAPLECYRCGKKEVASMVLGFSYVSSCGTLCCHVACGRINRSSAAAWTSTTQPETLSPINTRSGTPHIISRRATHVPRNIPRETPVSTNRWKTRGRSNHWRETLSISSHIEAIVRCKSGSEPLVVSKPYVPRKSLREIRFQSSQPEIPDASRREIER